MELQGLPEGQPQTGQGVVLPPPMPQSPVPHSGQLTPGLRELPVTEYRTPLLDAVAEDAVKKVPRDARSLTGEATPTSRSWNRPLAAGLGLLGVAGASALIYAVPRLGQETTVSGQASVSGTLKPGPSPSTHPNKSTPNTVPSAPTIKTLEKQYPPMQPEVVTTATGAVDPSNTGTAAFELLRDLEVYNVTGDARYLEAALPPNLATQQAVYQAGGEAGKVYDSLKVYPSEERMAVIAKMLDKFNFDQSSGGTELDITTQQYDPQVVAKNGTGLVSVVHHVNLGVTEDAHGKSVFFIRSYELVSTTPIK